MSNLTLSFTLILAAAVTAWVIINRHKQTVLEEMAEELKERQAADEQNKQMMVQKYKQLQTQLKDPLIQSLWSLLEDAFSQGLIEKFSDEQFKVSQDEQRIDLAMCWIAKDDGLSQLALRRLAHKHATDIAVHYGLFLNNMVCDQSHLELQFNENSLIQSNDIS